MARHSHTAPSISDIKFRHVLPLLLVLLTLYIVLPQLGAFRDSLEVVRTAEVFWLFIGFCSIVVSVLSAAAAYRLLTIRPLRYRVIASVQFSSMFISRLLPAGLGGISLFIAFFHKQKHTLGQSSAIVAVNSLLGLPGHLIVAGLFMLFFGISLPSFTLPEMQAEYIGLLIVGLLFGLWYAHQHTRQFFAFAAELRKTLRVYQKNMHRVIGALVFAAGNTTFHVVALYCVFAAFSVQLPIGAAFIVMTTGVLVATASPTPGGLVGAEAGLSLALLAYGVSPATAIAVALTYRLLSYWVPLLIGIPVFLYVRKKQYV